MALRAPVLAFAAFAFGAALAAAALWEGSAWDAALATDEPARLAIEVVNLGTHEARADVDVAQAGGALLFSRSWDVPPNASRGELVPQRVRGELVATARVSWSDVADEGSGTFRHAFDAGECPGGTLTLRLRFDTTRGVAFLREDRTSCA